MQIDGDRVVQPTRIREKNVQSEVKGKEKKEKENRAGGRGKDNEDEDR